MQAGGDWFDLTANSWLPLAEPSVPDTGISTIQTSQFIHSEASLAAKSMQVAPSTPSTSPPHPPPPEEGKGAPFSSSCPLCPSPAGLRKEDQRGLLWLVGHSGNEGAREEDITGFVAAVATWGQRCGSLGQRQPPAPENGQDLRCTWGRMQLY